MNERMNESGLEDGVCFQLNGSFGYMEEAGARLIGEEAQVKT